MTATEGGTPGRLELTRLIQTVEGQLSSRECALLFLLAARARAGCVVEVGSYRGRSTVALALGARSGGGARLFAVEPHEPFVGPLGGRYGPADRAHFFANLLRMNVAEDVRLLNLDSERLAPGWREPVALLWIDGDHSHEGVRRDWRAWERHLKRDATVAFHDSLDPSLGPHVLIAELVGAGTYEVEKVVDQTTVLQRRAR